MISIDTGSSSRYGSKSIRQRSPAISVFPSINSLIIRRSIVAFFPTSTREGSCSLSLSHEGKVHYEFLGGKEFPARREYFGSERFISVTRARGTSAQNTSSSSGELGQRLSEMYQQCFAAQTAQ